MREPPIHLETTLLSLCVDGNRGFAHENIIALFRKIAAGENKIPYYTKRNQEVMKCQNL